MLKLPELKVYRVSGRPDPSDLAKYDLDEEDTAPNGVDDPLELEAWSNLDHVLTNGSRTRFSRGKIGVAYTATEVETAVFEKGYWVNQLIFKKPNTADAVEVLEFNFDVNGKSRDYTSAPLYDPELTNPDTDQYEHCHKVSDDCIEAELDFIKAPSARRNQGVNIPLFRKNALPLPGPSVIEASKAIFTKGASAINYASTRTNMAVVFQPVYPNWHP